MSNMWTVASVNGVEHGQEGEWTSLDQIQGHQTLIRNNLFGICFRIIGTYKGKFSDIYIPEATSKEERKKNDEITYKISEFGVNRSNSFYRILKESGIDMEKICESIKANLEKGEWTWSNVRGLMDYGVIAGIDTKLTIEDLSNGTHTRDEFLSVIDMEKLKEVESAESTLCGFDMQRLEYIKKALELFGGANEAWVLLYKRYKDIVEERQKSLMSGAEQILEYIKKHNLTIQDLSLALTMARATKTGVQEAESHIINERTNGENVNKEEPSQT